MALVDPSIAMSFRGIQLPPPVNALAQASQLMQIQQAQAQMDEYQRARQEEENLRNYLSATQDMSSPAFRTGLMGYGKPGRELYKNILEAEKTGLEQRKLTGELSSKAMSVYQNMVDIIGTKQDAIRFLTRMVNDPDLKDSPIAKTPLMEQVARIPEDPAGLDEWKKKFAIGAVKWAELNKPQFFAQGERGVVAIPGMNGAATVVPGTPYTKPPSQADILARQRLEFDKLKFNWERANPGYELEEANDGSFYGINKRTLQAFPVTIAPPGAAVPAPVNALAPQAAAPINAMVQPPAVAGMVTPAYSPAALPAAAGPAALPAVAAPAAAAPAVVPAPAVAPPPPAPAVAPKQLVGKGKGAGKLSEGESNAVAFGMRMKESNAILEKLFEKGVTRGANIESVPFVGESLGKVLPSFLGGTSAEQQQVNQAKRNFITAVLRKESGATIQPSEFETEDKKYFPQFNDSPQVIAQKATARKLAIKAMMHQAGPGSKYIEEYVPSVNIQSSSGNPLGLDLGGK